MDVLDVFPMSACDDRQRVSGRASLAGQDESLFRQFQRVAVALSAERDGHRLLELIVTKCREVTTADAGSLYLVQHDQTKTRDGGWPGASGGPVPT